MSRYFYAVATLPYLSYETESFMSPEEYLSFCQSQLKGPDYSTMSTVSLLPPLADGHTDTERKYYRFERGLRNALVRLRASRLGIDASDFIATTREGNDYSEDSTAAELARAAFSAATPLQAEEILDRGRWDMLAQLESGNFFNLDVMVIYYLRLLILTRKSARNRERGTEGYNAVYDKMTESMRMQELLERGQ